MTGPCNWDIDPDALGVCPAWNEYLAETQGAALDLATFWMWAATGRRFGPCPITVRPGASTYGEAALYQDFAAAVPGMGMPGGPFLFAGRWFNAGCATACCGSSACAVVLRGPVASIDEVLVDGDVVPASAYRVDVTNGAWLLVRTDGQCWPACQNFTRETTEEDTFEVSYEIGTPIPSALALATAMLACEYGKHLTGGVCSLPAKMTRLSRQGVEVEVAAPDPASDKSGIKFVDDVVAMLNPSGLKSPPQVMSPDLDGGCDRITVIPVGS